MALGGTYKTGTVTIAVDKRSVTGVGTLWSPIVEVGDWLFIGGQVGLVAAVADDTHLSLDTDWQGTLPSASTYVVIKMSWLRYDPALTQSKVRTLLEEIEAEGNFLFVEGSEPDPDMGEDGQWALKTDVSPWQLWFKDSGIWIEQAAPAGLNWLGAWSAATAYAPADAVERNGSSYVSKTSNTNKPPESNPSDWDLMAAKGTTGATGATGPQGLVWRGTYASGTTYAANDGVAYNGASYISKVGSNTGHQPDISPIQWDLLAQSGSASIAPSSVTPSMLDSDNSTEQLAFRTRLNFASREGDTFTGHVLLPTNATPLAAHAVRKDYVDAGDAVAVHYDVAQSLTDAQRTQGRTNIAAAPFDALAFNGMQVNGSMEVSQEFGGVTTTFTAGASLQNRHFVDGMVVSTRGSFAVGMTQTTIAQHAGYKNTVLLTVSTAQASLGANDELSLMFPIEGERIARLAFGGAAAQPISVGFRFTAGRTGPFSGSIRNAAKNRSYPFTFTLPTTADSHWVSLTNILADITGTWEKESLVGMYVTICLAGGSSRLGTAGAWAAADYSGATGTVNNVGSTSDYVYFSGLLVLPGIELPPASRSPFIMRPFDSELTLCRRYFESAYVHGVLPGSGGHITSGQSMTGGTESAKAALYIFNPDASASRRYAQAPFLATKRAAPSLKFWDGNGNANAVTVLDSNGSWAGENNTSDTFRGVVASRDRIEGTNAVSGYYGCVIMWAADARLS